MQSSRKVAAAVVALVLAAGLALLLAVRAHDLSPVPDPARGVPFVEAAFGLVGRIDPWVALALVLALLGWLFAAALPRRASEEDAPSLSELADQVWAHREESREQFQGLREEIARELERATAEFEERITDTLRKGISAQDTQVRKTLDHFNARAGWQIQQLSARLEGLPSPAPDPTRAPSP